MNFDIKQSSKELRGIANDSRAGGLERRVAVAELQKRASGSNRETTIPKSNNISTDWYESYLQRVKRD